MEQTKSISAVTVSILTILAVTSLIFLSGCTSQKTKINTPKVIDGFSSPESVIADPAGERFFVSNMGDKIEPSTKDSDGYISEVSSGGVILTKKYLPKTGVLDAPKGMAIINRTLFVTDIDRIVGFDLITREQNFELDFSSENTSFLNDLAVYNENTLFVSATDIGKIYKISIDKEPHFTLLSENIPGANGLYFDKISKRLFVVTFGEGYEFNGLLGVISFRDNGIKYQNLTGRIGALDGIALLPDSKILFSDWVGMNKAGLMHVYDLKTNELSIMNLSEEVSGPADFFYDEINNNIWLPRMVEGKILIENLTGK